MKKFNVKADWLTVGLLNSQDATILVTMATTEGVLRRESGV